MLEFRKGISPRNATPHRGARRQELTALAKGPTCAAQGYAGKAVSVEDLYKIVNSKYGGMWKGMGQDFKYNATAGYSPDTFAWPCAGFAWPCGRVCLA